MNVFSDFFGYPFWEKMAGSPARQAEAIKRNPCASLCAPARFIEEPEGLAVAVISDGCGITAVALALLGAKVTVFSETDGAKQYMTSLAQATGVSVELVVSPLADIDKSFDREQFDAIIVEGATLHFQADLQACAHVLHDMLKKDGVLVSGIYPFDADLTEIMLFSQPGLLSADEAEYMRSQVQAHGHAQLGLLQKQDMMKILSVFSMLFNDCKYRTDENTADGARFMIVSK